MIEAPYNNVKMFAKGKPGGDKIVVHFVANDGVADEKDIRTIASAEVMRGILRGIAFGRFVGDNSGLGKDLRQAIGNVLEYIDHGSDDMPAYKKPGDGSLFDLGCKIGEIEDYLKVN